MSFTKDQLRILHALVIGEQMEVSKRAADYARLDAPAEALKTVLDDCDSQMRRLRNLEDAIMSELFSGR